MLTELCDMNSHDDKQSVFIVALGGLQARNQCSSCSVTDPGSSQFHGLEDVASRKH